MTEFEEFLEFDDAEIEEMFADEEGKRRVFYLLFSDALAKISVTIGYGAKFCRLASRTRTYDLKLRALWLVNVRN